MRQEFFDKSLSIPRYLNILTVLSFFDSVLLSQEDRGWMFLRGCMISLFRERFFREEIRKVSHPPDIEGRAVWAYPVLLCAPPVGLPKTLALFGIVDIHDVHPKNPFNVYRLGKNSTFNDRRNYYITI